MQGLLDIKEAAELLGIGITSMRSKAVKGQVPCFKMGNRWKFDPEKLKEWWKQEALIQESQRDK
jgi:excisionase family DNA binding protein